MKTIPINLLNHYAQKQTTLATVFKLTLKNGEVMGFTSFDKDVVFSEEPTIVYKAFSGMTPSAITSSSAFNLDNLEIQGFLEDERITEADLKYGKYDHAEVVIREFNWADTPYSLSKTVIEKKGKIGEIRIEGGKFVAELVGLTVYLSNKLGPLYQSTCRADLGDSKCGVNLTTYKSSSSVTSVTGNFLIYTTIARPAGYFDGGKITFTSGLNTGLSYEIKTWDGTKIELQIPANYTIAPTNTFDAFPGCNKTITICQNTYGNAVNFRGEPYIPMTSQTINS